MAIQELVEEHVERLSVSMAALGHVADRIGRASRTGNLWRSTR
jgi:hypothetical protein